MPPASGIYGGSWRKSECRRGDDRGHPFAPPVSTQCATRGRLLGIEWLAKARRVSSPALFPPPPRE